MKASDLIQVLCAAHLARHVESPFTDRGGIILLGPPGVLKSTFIDVLDANYADVCQMSDVNAKSLVALRDNIAAGVISTLCLPEFGKIYERNEATASNVEGVIKALVAEGFQAASFEDQQVNRLRARAMVIGAMTPAVHSRHSDSWRENGFTRRFLFPLIRLDNPGILIDAIMDWRLLDFDLPRIPRAPVGPRKIPMSVVKAERHQLVVWCKHQSYGSNTIPVSLLVKIMSVLRWWYATLRVPDNSMAVMERFAESLGKGGGAAVEMELKTPPLFSTHKRRKVAKRTIKRRTR